MKAIFALIFTSLLSFAALAHDDHDHGTPGGAPTASPHAGDHTAEFCTDDTQTFCAHLHFLADVSSSTEGSFITHVEVPDNQPINNLKIDLWMDMGHGHGHGSAPVEIADAGSNHFKVTNAWFVMAGPWLARIDFDFNGTHQHIEIPIYVAQ